MIKKQLFRLSRSNLFINLNERFTFTGWKGLIFRWGKRWWIKLEQVQKEQPKWSKGIEHVTYKEKLKRLGLCNFLKR